MKKLFRIAALACVSLTHSFAQTTWTVDSGNSSVEFTATHFVVSEITGRFTEFSGTVRMNEADFSSASLEADINSESVNTSNEGRDKHLKAADMLGAEQYPKMHFKSTSVKKNGDNTYRLLGELTIKGVTKPIELEATVTGVARAFGRERMGVKAKGTINRFDYGITYNQTMDGGGLVVGEKVELKITAELVREKESAKK